MRTNALIIVSKPFSNVAAQLILALAACLLPLTEGAAQSAQSQDPEVQALIQRLPDRGRLGELGLLTVGIFPQAVLNGKAIVMAPGARIYSLTNAITTPGSVSGLNLQVTYKIDFLGQVIEAWVVSDDEVKALKKFAKSLGK